MKGRKFFIIRIVTLSVFLINLAGCNFLDSLLGKKEDNEPPRISHTPVLDEVEGYPIPIECNVAGKGIEFVKLHYQSVNVSTFTAVDMKKEGDIYTAEISSQPSSGTVYYYITAADKNRELRSPAEENYEILIAYTEDVPTGLTAQITDHGYILLKWMPANLKAYDATVFSIYRNVSYAGTYTCIASCVRCEGGPWPEPLFYIDQDPKSGAIGITYYYKIAPHYGQWHEEPYKEGPKSHYTCIRYP